MPARLEFVKLYDDLEAAGGTCTAACWPWTALKTTYRTDGDNRLSGTISRTQPGAASITVGSVLRLERADDSVEEWIVNVVRDVYGSDEVEVTALSARTWLAERVVVRSGGTLSLSGTDTISNVLTTLLATDEWPSWVVAGTISNDVTVDYTWSSTNGLAALLGIVSAANGNTDIVLANEEVRLAFRRVSASQYAVDFLTTAATGDPTLIEGKNVSSFAVRRERSQQIDRVFPVGSDSSGIGEAYFLVQNFSAGPKTLELRDWAFRDDRLGVAYDDQWVGYYVIAPDGTANLITASDSATQTVTLSTTTGIGTDDFVRISPDSGGGTLYYVQNDAVTNPKAEVYTGTFTGKINWAVNARFDEWVSAASCEHWGATGGMTVAQDSTNEETGTYCARLTTTTGAQQFTMNLARWPDEIIDNGGTTTWRAGMRCKRVAGGNTFAFQYSKNGGSTWTTLASSTGSATYETVEATFTTAAADTGNTVALRVFHNASAGNQLAVDRVWLFRDTVDTGDNTLVGNGPTLGLYEGNRRLLQRRAGGTTYEVGVIDRYRDTPSAYPNDNLTEAQEARLIVPSRSVDTTLTVAQLDVDELRPTKTNAQFGALRRRLTSNL